MVASLSIPGQAPRSSRSACSTYLHVPAMRVGSLKRRQDRYKEIDRVWWPGPGVTQTIFSKNRKKKPNYWYASLIGSKYNYYVGILNDLELWK